MFFYFSPFLMLSRCRVRSWSGPQCIPSPFGTDPKITLDPGVRLCVCVWVRPCVCQGARVQTSGCESMDWDV